MKEGRMTFSEVIRESVKVKSINILKEDGLFLSVFSDLAPELKKEKKIIKRLCEENMMSHFYFLITSAEDDKSSRIEALSTYMSEEIGLSEEWIQEVVDAFVLAFDLNISNLKMKNSIQETANYFETEINRQKIVDEDYELENDKKLLEYIKKEYYPEREIRAVLWCGETYNLTTEKAVKIVGNIWEQLSQSKKKGITTISHGVFNTYLFDSDNVMLSRFGEIISDRINEILTIGPVTLNSGPAIARARKNYEMSTKSQKFFIDKYFIDLLSKAEREYKELVKSQSKN